MKKCTVIVEGYTRAIRLRNLLTRAKIKSRQIKLDNTDKKAGCAHGIELLEEDFFSAVVIMKENGIPYSLLNTWENNKK